MRRFNVNKYDPSHDSSPGTSDGGVVYLNRPAGACECGCGQTPTNPKSRFLMGHDARLKGVLLRAHLAEVKVVLAFEDQTATHTAISVAKLYDSDTYSWTDALRRAEAAFNDRPAPKPRLVVPPKGPRVGDKTTVRVGRWEYAAEVLQVDTSRVVLQYATKSGEIKTITQAAPGSIEVK